MRTFSNIHVGKKMYNELELYNELVAMHVNIDGAFVFFCLFVFLVIMLAVVGEKQNLKSFCLFFFH